LTQGEFNAAMIEWLADNGGVYNSAHTGQQIDDAVSAAAGAASADLTNVLDTDFISKAESAGVGTQIETVGYGGTGLYGASNPTIITASFEPKLIAVTASALGSSLLLHLPPYIIPPLPLGAIAKNNHYYEVDIAVPGGNGYTTIKLRRSLDGKTISLYSDKSAEYQLNAAAFAYYCTLIG